MKPRLASLLGHRRVRLPLVQQRAALSGREVADAAHLVADRAAHVADLLLVAAHVVAEHRARPHVSSLGGQTRNPYDLTRTPGGYTAALSASALKGARIGLLTDMMGRDPIHHDVNQVVERAVERIDAMGATVVRITVPGLEDLTRGLSVMAFEFRTAFDAYLAGLDAAAPVKSLAEFVARGEFHESMRRGLEADLKVVDGPGSPEHQRMVARRNVLRQAIMTVMAANRLDAILYPHQKRLVVPIGEDQAERNGVLSNSTGFPALTFPGGFSPPTASAPIGVPVGLELLGPEWSEPVLFRLAFAFEQAARPRKPLASTPPLK